MPQFGLLSSIYPACLIGESLAFPKFPSWLGKNSSARKNRRESIIFKYLISTSTYSSTDVPAYARIIMKILKYHLEKSDIETACHFVEEYNLNPDLIKAELVDLQF